MSGIIVYRTSTGSTKEYTDWIAEATGYTVYESKDGNIPWETSDTVVIGCPIVALKPALAGWISKNWNRMQGKRIVLFTTSGADPADNPVIEWIEKALPDEILSKIRVFPLPGRFDYARLKGTGKAMIWFAARILGDKDVKHQMKNPVDNVAKEKLTPLLEYIQKTE